MAARVSVEARIVAGTACFVLRHVLRSCVPCLLTGASTSSAAAVVDYRQLRAADGCFHALIPTCCVRVVMAPHELAAWAAFVVPLCGYRHVRLLGWRLPKAVVRDGSDGFASFKLVWLRTWCGVHESVTLARLISCYQEILRRINGAISRSCRLLSGETKLGDCSR